MRRKIRESEHEFPLDGDFEFLSKEFRTALAFVVRLRADNELVVFQTGYDQWRHCPWVKWYQEGLERRLLFHEQYFEYGWQSTRGGGFETIREDSEAIVRVRRFWKLIEPIMEAQRLRLSVRLRSVGEGSNYPPLY
jgi:hypothetical protein